MICRKKKYFAITGERFIKYEESESEVTQPCLTLCDPMDRSLSCSSIHGTLQARVLEWIAISSSRGLPTPTQESNPGLSNCRQTPHHLSHQGSLSQII